MKENNSLLKGKQSRWWQIHSHKDSMEGKYKNQNVRQGRGILQMNIEEWIHIAALISSGLPAGYKRINGNFENTNSSVQEYKYIVFRILNPYRGYLNTFECVCCLGWHTCWSAGAVKVVGLRDGICRITSPSVAKLKTCSRTYPDTDCVRSSVSF